MFRNTSTIKKEKEKIDGFSEVDNLNLTTLPTELLFEIAAELSDKDPANLRQVNTFFYGVLKPVADVRLEAFISQLGQQYQHLMGNNAALRRGVGAQLVSDRALLQRMVASPLVDSYPGEDIYEQQVRRGFGISLVFAGFVVAINATVMLAWLFSDNEYGENSKIDYAIMVLMLASVPALICISNMRLISIGCRNGAYYTSSSLRIFSGRTAESKLAHRIEELEKRMEAGEANKQNDIAAEDFNARLLTEPSDLVDETAPLLAARI